MNLSITHSLSQKAAFRKILLLHGALKDASTHGDVSGYSVLHSEHSFSFKIVEAGLEMTIDARALRDSVTFRGEVKEAFGLIRCKATPEAIVAFSASIESTIRTECNRHLNSPVARHCPGAPEFSADSAVLEVRPAIPV